MDAGIIELAVVESLYFEAIYSSLFFGSFYVAITSYITEENVWNTKE